MLRLSKHTDESDEKLIALYSQTGNREYIGSLFERYASFVFAVSMKYLKDREKSRDNTMQVFEKLITNLNRFQVKNFKAWLHIITKNECLMYLRNQKSKMKKDNEYSISEKEFMENGTDVHLSEKEDREMNLQNLEQAISSLSDKQKICIELFYLKEKSYTEISGITGFSLNEVKSYIQNGKRNLKIYMENSNAG